MPRKIRLLTFLSNFNIGGTEKQVLYLLQNLDPERFDLHVACLKRYGPLLNLVEASGLPLSEYRIESFWKYATIRQQLRFAHYIRRHQIDIVHSYGFYTNMFAIPAARLAAAPLTVASIRDTGAYLTEVQKRAQRMACLMTNHILVNAEAVKRWLVDTGYRGDKITVIRNGIVLFNPPAPNTRHAVRREFGIPLDAPVVGVHSRLSPVKGIDYLLQAARAILARFPETRFLIIGDDGLHNTYKQVLEDQASFLGIRESVIFTGFRLDVPALLSAVDISVLPSLTEGLSNSLLESMAASRPVVATRVGGNLEIVDEGRSGLLVPPKDPAAIAQAICRLIADPNLARSFGQAGRERVLSMFSMTRSAQETERFYLDLVESARLIKPRMRREKVA